MGKYAKELTKRLNRRFPAPPNIQRYKPKAVRFDKGIKGGACNVTACQAPNSAFFYNRHTNAHYCDECAREINRFDPYRDDPERCIFPDYEQQRRSFNATHRA